MATTQGIKLDETTKQRLKALGEKRHRSPHWLMKAAIEDYLNREERYERELEEDQAEYEEYLLTGKAIQNDVVVAWLDELARGNKVSWPK